ncbi:uncharacterized protein [Choristoneura fumiferana]|uniref:uncharacterized protein n=1 Tax=Choristoneura fumiferana TaxID=7141 RepID=UPI003D15B121
MSKSEELCNLNKGLRASQSNNKPNDAAGKTKKNLLDYFPPCENKSNKMVSKATQVNSTWITEEDISSDVPSENFWQTVAEKRRAALAEALDENERLHKLHDSLTEENNKYQALLDEANSFVDVFKELVQNNADDTGIDVRDLNSSAEPEY